ncbi:flagellar basal body-associated protein FliL [Pontibaca salina]|uniref:Flagellar basal body-associated protein FliL n=1 Tax=Pontibaca salina TaxID=2795731 RepID=A0A934HQ06_9RHOB|nr:flagellar basal body-associated protein FliL [Pontibaca salina]MBI6629392.1 flagellar basal body-associated protein FliL [Pontibaca salina]
MLARLLPILLVPLAIGTGGGAALYLMPPQEHEETTTFSWHEPADAQSGDHDYIKMNNQFVIPVVSRDRITALVILSLSLEITRGQRQRVYEREPKLRDSFLRVLFDHANMGGFNGPFTQEVRLAPLRVALRDAAQRELGKDIHNVLIVDIARQDP